jgi:hypothetical protein
VKDFSFLVIDEGGPLVNSVHFEGDASPEEREAAEEIAWRTAFERGPGSYAYRGGEIVYAGPVWELSEEANAAYDVVERLSGRAEGTVDEDGQVSVQAPEGWPPEALEAVRVIALEHAAHMGAGTYGVVGATPSEGG